MTINDPAVARDALGAGYFRDGPGSAALPEFLARFERLKRGFTGDLRARQRRQRDSGDGLPSERPRRHGRRMF